MRCFPSPLHIGTDPQLLKMLYFNTIQKEAWQDVREYKEDFKAVIRQREKNQIPFCHQSPQFPYRQHLIEFLKKICIEKKLSHCTLHLSIYLLDIFMDNHSIVPERVLLVTNVCLLLAAKFEENTLNIPKIIELNAAINDRYPLEEYKNLEVVILKFFNWYIMFPTAAHYTQYYMQAILTSSDLKDKQRSLRTIFYNLYDCLSEYLDKIIDSVHYMQCYTPSKLAAAIIGISRMEIGLPCWTEQLENMTEYKVEELDDLIILLKDKHPFNNCIKCQVRSN